MKPNRSRFTFFLYSLPVVLSLAACISDPGASGGGGCGASSVSCGAGTKKVTAQGGFQCVAVPQQ